MDVVKVDKSQLTGWQALSRPLPAPSNLHESLHILEKWITKCTKTNEKIAKVIIQYFSEPEIYQYYRYTEDQNFISALQISYNSSQKLFEKLASKIIGFALKFPEIVVTLPDINRNAPRSVANFRDQNTRIYRIIASYLLSSEHPKRPSDERILFSSTWEYFSARKLVNPESISSYVSFCPNLNEGLPNGLPFRPNLNFFNAMFIDASEVVFASRSALTTGWTNLPQASRKGYGLSPIKFGNGPPIFIDILEMLKLTEIHQIHELRDFDCATDHRFRFGFTRNPSNQLVSTTLLLTRLVFMFAFDFQMSHPFDKIRGKKVVVSVNTLCEQMAWRAEVPKEGISSVTYLELSQRNHIPSKINFLLPDLQHLDLGNNNLSSLPDGLWKLANLKTLDLSENNLLSIPEDLKNLTLLENLLLWCNPFNNLPIAIGDLLNLQILGVSETNENLLNQIKISSTFKARVVDPKSYQALRPENHSRHSQTSWKNGF